jgi:molybdopterin-guanine dinucleotide biosynthesis protein A
MPAEMHNPARPGASGFVLAGGRSTRMGRDKALLDFGGQLLIARAVGLLREAGLDTSISGERPDLAEFAPVVVDRVSQQGPLGGVCAALESMPGEWGVFLTVDVPLLPASLLRYMVERARATGAAVTLVSVGGDAETFPAVVSRAALPSLREQLESGRLKCFSAFRSAAEALGQTMDVVAVEALVEAGLVTHPGALGPADWFLNVNTPEEFARAEALASGGVS